MRTALSRLVPALAATALLAAFFLVPVQPVVSQTVQLYLDLVEPPLAPGVARLAVGDIPPNGSGWHELYPVYCGTWTQDGYQDNGDGVISACDVITLNGVDHHVTWAGPTYFTTCETPGLPPTPVIFEPTADGDPTNPICQVWHEVWPNFCQEIHIDSFLDENGSGALDECDVVDVQGATGPSYYHIDRIGCNIVVEPGGSTPTERSTWSLIKNKFLKG